MCARARAGAWPTGPPPLLSASASCSPSPSPSPPPSAPSTRRSHATHATTPHPPPEPPAPCRLRRRRRGRHFRGRHFRGRHPLWVRFLLYTVPPRHGSGCWPPSTISGLMPTLKPHRASCCASTQGTCRTACGTNHRAKQRAPDTVRKHTYKSAGGVGVIAVHGVGNSRQALFGATGA
jgi:hypothetical protein